MVEGQGAQGGSGLFRGHIGVFRLILGEAPLSEVLRFTGFAKFLLYRQ